MANGPAFEDAVAKAQENPSLDIGCHLVLVGGPPVAPPDEIPSLIRGDGHLPRSLWELVCKLSAGLIHSECIEREFQAQIEKILAAGVAISHLDTHKHTHTHPSVMDAVFRVARRFRISRVRKPFEDMRIASTAAKNGASYPLAQRVLAIAAGLTASTFRRGLRSYNLRSPDRFVGVLMTGNLGAAALRGLIEHLPDGTTEIMCHPGLYDAELERTPTRLKMHRERELEALLDSGVRDAIRSQGVQLIPYRDLN